MKKSKRKSSISTEGTGKQNTKDETESDRMDVGIKKKKRKHQQIDREGEDLPNAKSVHVSEEKQNTGKKRENKMKDKETKTDQGGITQTEGKENLKLKNSQKRKSSNTAEANQTNETGNSEYDHTEKPTKKKKRKLRAQVEELENDAVVHVESVDKSNSDKEAKETTKSKKKKKKVKESENDAVEESSVNVAIEGSGDRPDDAEVKKTPQSKKKKKKLVQKESENDSVEGSGDKPDDAEVKKTPKSKKKKKKEKNVNENDQPILDPDQKADKLASEYLKQWSSDRKSWKFQKVRQVWLLKHMYNSEQVNSDDFEILLQYLDGLKGKSREVTVKQAEKIIEEDDDENVTDETKTERARQIVQLLC